MAVTLETVVPFGRSLNEYHAIFNLTEADRAGSILGVADGPASFNAEATRAGMRVTSIDPLYALDAGRIRDRFYACVDGIMDQVKATPDDWVWTYHASPEDLRANREQSLETFAADLESGKEEGRYVEGSLPALPFANGQFDLALCSHFLFLYSDHFPLDFHYDAIREMLRVAREVRIYPLLTLALRPSPHYTPIMKRLADDGYESRVEKTVYEVQKGANEMLIVRAPN